MPRRKVLARLATVREAVREAEMDLEDFLLELHDSSHWQEVTYGELAAPMGCTRQAVAQRVQRLLEVAHTRQWRKETLRNPNQLALGD